MIKWISNLFASRQAPTRQTGSGANSQTPSLPTEPVPPAVPATPPVPAQCLAYAAFQVNDTNEICGEIWLLSTDAELVNAHAIEAPMPEGYLQKMQGAPLAIMTVNSYQKSCFIIAPARLEPLMQAIRSGDAARLHAMNAEFAPFYCPKCRLSYKDWAYGPIFDEEFYDFMEGSCPKGHRVKISD